ncbi:hypothetical protein BH11BAC3_BH11BAC3_16670 [soil metagenome]
MDYLQKDKNVSESIVGESDQAYENAATSLLKEALNRTYTERFLFATRLYKIQQTLSKAKITHQASSANK